MIGPTRRDLGRRHLPAAGAASHPALRMRIPTRATSCRPRSRWSPSWPSTRTRCTRPTGSWSGTDWREPAGLGTFIARSPSRPARPPRRRYLAGMTDWLRSARSAGLDPDDIEAMYRTRVFRACFAEEGRVMSAVIEASGLGKQYRRQTWALRNCTLAIPRRHHRARRTRTAQASHPAAAGRRAARRHPRHDQRPRRGLRHQASASAGSARRPGHAGLRPHAGRGSPPARCLAQPRLGVASWRSGGSARIGMNQGGRQRLSGGQRAQLALTLALAKRPELLLLDEPLASLDPLARGNSSVA